MYMEQIKKADLKAYEWLQKIPSHMWARCQFDSRVKSEHITNNMSESFCQWIGHLRGKPILTLIETLMVKIMGRVHTRYSDGLLWEGNLTPNALKKVNFMRKMTTRISLVPVRHMEFLVNDNGIKFIVDLKEKTCICRYWEISGLMNMF